MHISDPEPAAWLKERIEGYGKDLAKPLLTRTVTLAPKSAP